MGPVSGARLTRTGRYVICSFHKGQQMNDPKWGWDTYDAAARYAEQLAADNGNTDCEWAIYDRVANVEIARCRVEQ